MKLVKETDKLEEKNQISDQKAEEAIETILLLRQIGWTITFT